MRVLVTGGAGFIGSHLCEFLVENGHEVKAVDDLSTGKYKNVAGLDGNRNFELIADTVLNKYLVDSVVKRADVVFHLASAVGVRLIIDHPVRTIETIVEGTNNILTYARKYGKKVLITSSSEVYGKGKKIPFSENDDTVMGPTSTRRWAYGTAKAIDEFLAFAHWYESHLPVICVRLFNTVGPRQTGQYGMVIPTFIKQAMSGEDITVYGTGRQTRSFCHVKDVVPALVDLMQCESAVGKVVNLGSDEETSILSLALRVKVLTHSESPIVYVPYREAYTDGFEDMDRRVPDISVAHDLIGFRPVYGLDNILKSIIEVGV